VPTWMFMQIRANPPAHCLDSCLSRRGRVRAGEVYVVLQTCTAHDDTRRALSPITNARQCHHIHAQNDEIPVPGLPSLSSDPHGSVLHVGLPRTGGMDRRERDASREMAREMPGR
jgi:hypothetical protein